MMIRLPPKRSRQRSGIEREIPREWRVHKRFIKSKVCLIPECPTRFETIVPDAVDIVSYISDPHHLRTAANSGTGLKPGDWNLIPLCRIHHDQFHDGKDSFVRAYRDSLIRAYGTDDLFEIAAEFVRRSPDTKMREALGLK